MVSILEKNYYNVYELVEILKVSSFTIREYLKAGKLKGRKIAKQWLVSEKELNEFLEKGV
ncbi:hypothetical protein ES702_02246 [subsurface metagenome]